MVLTQEMQNKIKIMEAILDLPANPAQSVLFCAKLAGKSEITLNLYSFFNLTQTIHSG